MNDQSLDQIVLDQLKQAGSDFDKPHNVDFAFYFPTEEKANEAKGPIEQFLEVYVKRIEPSAYHDYLLEASKNMMLDLSTMQNIREQLNKIAVEFDGIYDGWGAMIEK